MVRAIYDCWAEILTYPGEERAGKLNGWIEEIACVDEAAGSALEPLARYRQENGDSALEELFVRTFENNAERALELGWHLHGENYARGSFMARMRGLLRENGIEESHELPDHISHVLKLMARAREELAAAMAHQVVTPSLEKIRGGFKDTANPYAQAIAGLARFVAEEHAQPVGGPAR